MAKILVIGAAESCLGLIRTIKRIGHEAVVIANDPSLPGVHEASTAKVLDDYDVQGTIDFARSVGIDAIVPVPVDRPLIWQAKVAEALGLPFLSVESATAFRHKYLMKQRLQAQGVATAKGILTKIDEFLPDLLNGFDYPLIVKPIDGYASRGVVRVENEQELMQQMMEASDFSSDSSVVIEEFIGGQEYSVEGICFNGKCEIYAVVEKMLDPYPRTVEMGHIVPPNVSAEDEKKITDIVERAISAMGMTVGAYNAEVKLYNGKAHIIEVNGRVAGDFTVSHLVVATSGQDMEAELVKACLGIQPEAARRKYVKSGMIRYFNLPAGKRVVKCDLSGLEKYGDDLIFVKNYYKPGDLIPEVMHSGHRAGMIIILADNREKLLKKCNAAIRDALQGIELA